MSQDKTLLHIAMRDDLRHQLGLGSLYGADTALASLAIIENPGDLDAAGLGVVRQASIPVLSIGPISGSDAVASAEGLDAAIAEMAPLARRFADLSDAALSSDDPAIGLLAFIAIRDGMLRPATNFAIPQVVDFAERARFPDLDALIEALAAKDLLVSAFAERVNQCPNCLSARILVRDQCPHCASSNVRDQAVIHHFSCAAHAPEQQFFDGEGRLRCPKCRRHLRAVSVDYEVSTELCECQSCGEISQQPDVGFRCTDCNSLGTGEALLERDVSSFSVTAAGLALIFGTNPDAAPDLGAIR